MPQFRHQPPIYCLKRQFLEGGSVHVDALPKLRYFQKFRPYQAAAIDMARRYRQQFYAPDTSQTAALGAALVCHPTGTGKTAVIAGLAQCAPEIGNVLILTTRQ